MDSQIANSLANTKNNYSIINPPNGDINNREPVEQLDKNKKQ
jgi:hypothetical protein